MAYEARLSATDDGDWIQTVELFNDETGDPLEGIEGAAFEFEVSDGYSPILTASTKAGNLVRSDEHVVTWRFRPAELCRLEVGRSYTVGLRMTIDDDVVVPLFAGTLNFLKGGFVR